MHNRFAVNSTLIATLMVACLTMNFTSITIGQAEMLEYPYEDTPLVSVYEIGDNWVRVKGHFSVTEVLNFNEPFTLDHFVLDPIHFNPDNPDHMNQVQILGDYTCGLFNRRGVILSQELDNTTTPIVLRYLIACALP